MMLCSLSALALLFVLAAVALPAAEANADTPPAKITYPPARRGDTTDEYHGTKVPDPYRWLENADAPETKAWVEAENKITEAYLAAVPARGAIKNRITELWNYERYGTPFKEGGRYFYSKNDGLQNQSVLYVADAPDKNGRVLLDPNALSKDGTVALSGYAISDDGKFMAYGLASAGSDWNEWRVKNVDTGQDTGEADHLRWVKFSGVSWLKDGSGFFYSRYDEPKKGEELQQANYYQKLFFHKRGTPQEKDVLVYQRPDEKEWGFGGSVSDDGRYLILYVSQGTERKNRVFYKDLRSGGLTAPVVELLPDLDASYSFIDNDGPIFFFQTDKNAPRGRVIAIDTSKPEAVKNAREIIPQSDETLQGVGLVGDHFLASYLKDAYTQVKVFDLSGKFVRNVDLPGIGTAGGFGGKRKDTETFYAFSGFTTPTTIFKYDVSSGKSSVLRAPKVDFDPARYETKQVFYHSKDGTRVPLFLVHRKGLKLNGANPTLLYGYGGFNASMTPFFSTTTVTWMEMGGVYAVACLRGGGEYGEAWHEAGKKLKKQNVFDDFIAGAEWLIANKYTRPDKLAISGGSNGGLLVGACLIQRPDLFGAALPAVGVMDMLRFPKFTIGWAWTSDYGTPDNPDEFKALYAYSPYHNLKPGKKYPATLVTTSDHDDRVVPAHSFKFAAALQHAQAGNAPTLIRIETDAGHGAGKPISKSIEEIADRYAFLVRALNVTVPADFGKLRIGRG